MQMALSGERNVTDYESITHLLSEEIKDSPYTMKQIANHARLSPNTVSRLYYRETRFPRYHTVVALLTFFGYGLYARKTNVAPLHLRRRGQA